MEREKQAQEYEREEDVEFLDAEIEGKIVKLLQDTMSFFKWSLISVLTAKVMESAYVYGVDPSPHTVEKRQEHTVGVAR